MLNVRSRGVLATVAGVVAFSCFILIAACYPAVSTGTPIIYEVEWLPQLGLNFTLRMDGYAWMFAALISGIGALVVIYARYYLSPNETAARFFSFLLAFMGAMLGIVISGNLILLAVFWELTSIFSFMLISYWHNNAAARDGARMALTITGIGGFCLLIGFLLIGNIVGSYDLDKVLSSGDIIRAWSADQERAVSLPFLAAQRHGGADSGLGLSAFRHDGQSRCVPAGAPVAGAIGHL
jgi:multicomponent K+:H+ antiporter subunit A